MAVSLTDYEELLLKLLPRGHAWIGARFQRLIKAFAPEVFRADGAVNSLFREALPTTTSRCLADWERVAGIPDGVFTLADTDASRRRVLIAKLSAQGGQSAAYYERILIALGFTATIVADCRPFVAGSHAGDLCYDNQWVHVFMVHVLAMPNDESVTYDSGAGLLRRYSNARLETIMNALKPAHAVALYDYTEV